MWFHCLGDEARARGELQRPSRELLCELYKRLSCDYNTQLFKCSFDASLRTCSSCFQCYLSEHEWLLFSLLPFILQHDFYELDDPPNANKAWF